MKRLIPFVLGSIARTLPLIAIAAGAQAQEAIRYHRPVFMPDGAGFVVMSDRDGDAWELYRVRLDGTLVHRLTRHSGWDGYADVSPIGRQVVFERTEEAGRSIVLADLDKGNERRLIRIDDGFLGGPRFAPDGLSVIFLSEEAGNREIYRQWLTADRRERITETEQNETDAVFSTDGSSLAYAVWLDDSSMLETLDLESGTVRRVVTVGGRLYGVAWSTDGKTLFYNADTDGDQEIYKVSLKGRRPVQLTANESSDHLPAVSPDGRTVLFTSEREGPEAVFLLDLESGEQRRIDVVSSTKGDERVSLIDIRVLTLRRDDVVGRHVSEDRGLGGGALIDDPRAAMQTSRPTRSYLKKVAKKGSVSCTIASGRWSRGRSVRCLARS